MPPIYESTRYHKINFKKPIPSQVVPGVVHFRVKDDIQSCAGLKLSDVPQIVTDQDAISSRHHLKYPGLIVRELSLGITQNLCLFLFSVKWLCQ